MAINTLPTRAPLGFADWHKLSPAEAARELHARVAALPEALRRAALAYLRTEKEMAAEFAQWNSLTSGRAERVGGDPLHPLAGVPFLVKDLFDVAGLPTNAGSSFLAKARPTPERSSSFVRRWEELGAVFAGKTHMVEFAAGLTGENRHFGDCPHPHFADRLAGGSSSGSAALVGAGVVPFALGTDTGGSVRVPAAFCGIYGFRLTPGHEWIRDGFPLSPTCDTPGWFTATAGDMRTALRALVGVTADAARPRGCYLSAADLGVESAPEFAAACAAAAARLAAPIDVKTKADLATAWADTLDTYTTVVLSEANIIHRNWLAPYHENYDPGIWQRITDGGRYPVEQHARAQQNLRRGRESWQRYFAKHDFLVMPCAPFPALRKSECTAESRRAILQLTAPASLGGFPALTIPVPLASGLTGGLQIVAAEATSPVFAWALRQ